jgi:hypothetical protein
MKWVHCWERAAQVARSSSLIVEDAPLGWRAPGRRFLFALPAFALAGNASAQKLQMPTMPTTWYGVQVEDNVFTVQMPGVPDHRIVSDVTARGTAFRLHSYSLDAGGASYVAQSAIYPGDVDGDPRGVLQSSIDGRAKSLEGGKWSQVDWRQVQGANAVETTGPLRGGNALRTLVLLKRRAFVSLAFLGDAGSINGRDADRFFSSLKLMT